MRVLGQPFQASDVLHQRKLVQALAGQTIIALMQSNAVIVDNPRNVNLLVQSLILFRPVQLELVRPDGFHNPAFAILRRPNGLLTRLSFLRSMHWIVLIFSVLTARSVVVRIHFRSCHNCIANMAKCMESAIHPTWKNTPPRTAAFIPQLKHMGFQPERIVTYALACDLDPGQKRVA